MLASKFENVQMLNPMKIFINFILFLPRLYGAGAQPIIPKLYRPISYPVSRGTPMLNSKIGWDHSQRFTVPSLIGDCKCFK